MSLYHSCVPVFSRYLNQLSGILHTAEAHSTATGAEAAQRLIRHQLQPDMLPAGQQANVAASFAERAFYLLQGKAVPPSNYDMDSFATLQRNIGAIATRLESLQAEQLIEPTSQITVTTGDITHSLTAEVYLSQLCLPNFFFHISMCYALFKQQGVPLGKFDFDGFHQFEVGTCYV